MLASPVGHFGGHCGHATSLANGCPSPTRRPVVIPAQAGMMEKISLIDLALVSLGFARPGLFCWQTLARRLQLADARTL